MWLWGLGGVGLLIGAAPTAGMLAILLAPAIGVRLLDRDPGHGLSRIVLVFGAATLARPVLRLWHGTADWPQALDMAAELGTLGTAWGAQALGWLLAEAAPLLLRGLIEGHAAMQGNRLREARARLEAEWAIPPPD